MRWVVWLLVVLLVLLQYKLWVGDGSLAEVWDLYQQVEAQKEENQSLRERNQALEAEVQDLKTSVHALLNEREDLTTQVQRDALTQLASRRYLLDVLNKAVDGASTDEGHLSIAMADLDHFKQVNDSLGHLVGDRVLKEVAQRLSKSVREQDLIGRYGGEEFLLIFPETALAVAQQVAERIREHVASTPIHLPEHTIPITISIGLTRYEPGDTLESLLQRADRAMYAAKQAGRNCVTVL